MGKGTYGSQVGRPKKRMAKSVGGKARKAMKVVGAIANPKAAVTKAVVGNVMGPKGQARRQKRRARRAARKASYVGGMVSKKRMSYGVGGEVMPKATPN